MFRVDHFLGKSTVLNLLGLRFANRIFEPLLGPERRRASRSSSRSRSALEGRAGYYDQAGALVDMIQSHLLLVLALATMEPPSRVGSEDLRGAMAAGAARDPALEARRHGSRRARYTAGTIGRPQAAGLRRRAGGRPARRTETLAEMTVAIDTWRWAGVPFVLRSGKALETRKEIVFTFKPPPHVPTGLHGEVAPTRLRLLLGPDRMAWEMNVNGPEDPFTLDHITLTADLNPGRLPAYGEVLAGVLDADPFLSVRGDAVEQCWRILAPVISAWRRGDVAMDQYPAGSPGPSHWPAL